MLNKTILVLYALTFALFTPRGHAGQWPKSCELLLKSIGLSDLLARDVPVLSALSWQGDETFMATNLRTSQGNGATLMFEQSGHFSLRVSSTRNRRRDDRLFATLVGILKQNGGRALIGGFDEFQLTRGLSNSDLWLFRLDARDEKTRNSLRDILTYISPGSVPVHRGLN